jgi:hypothetical protein
MEKRSLMKEEILHGGGGLVRDPPLSARGLS